MVTKGIETRLQAPGAQDLTDGVGRALYILELSAIAGNLTTREKLQQKATDALAGVPEATAMASLTPTGGTLGLIFVFGDGSIDAVTDTLKKKKKIAYSIVPIVFSNPLSTEAETKRSAATDLMQVIVFAKSSPDILEAAIATLGLKRLCYQGPEKSDLPLDSQFAPDQGLGFLTLCDMITTVEARRIVDGSPTSALKLIAAIKAGIGYEALIVGKLANKQKKSNAIAGLARHVAGLVSGEVLAAYFKAPAEEAPDELELNVSDPDEGEIETQAPPPALGQQGVSGSGDGSQSQSFVFETPRSAQKSRPVPSLQALARRPVAKAPSVGGGSKRAHEGEEMNQSATKKPRSDTIIEPTSTPQEDKTA